MGPRTHAPIIWGIRGIFATRSSAIRSGHSASASQGFEGPDFPLAAAGLASRALQPAFGVFINVTRQKIPAGASLGSIGLRQRRYRAPRAGRGVFPGLARILVPSGQHVGGGRARESEIGIRRTCMCPRGDGSGCLAILHLRESRMIPRHAAAAGRRPDHNRHHGGKRFDRG